MQIHPIIIGTAGHIDHGKTALVGALTGIDTDRLKVEKERGITTELGFAHLDLKGRRYGVVDVPGHERFIKAMVAGAAGVDLVCLVIAADEGVMPQTREHLDICQLLGVKRGVVALTKSDLADEEWIRMISEDIRGKLAGSFLADADIIPVSAKTGDGLDQLKKAFVTLGQSIPARSASNAFRLPVDRIFTMKGFGTVVTGTVMGGRVKVGDTVVALPRRVSGKVRGIQIHGGKVESARAGTRCAINLAGPSRDELERGDLITHPDAVAPSHIIDAQFRYLSTSKSPLGQRTRVLLHHGTAQLLATVVVVDKTTLAPGEEALVQLRLDASTPLAALPGDFFIARGFVPQEHYGTTIGGGEILRVKAPKARRSKDSAETIGSFATASERERIVLEVKGTGVIGATALGLSQRLGQNRRELADSLSELARAGDLVEAKAGEEPVYCHSEVVARLEKKAVDLVAEFQSTHPEKPGMAKAELREKLAAAFPGPLFDELISTLSRRQALATDKDIVFRPKATQTTSELSLLAQTIERRFQDWGLAPLRPKELSVELGESAKQVDAELTRLLSAGHLIKVKADLYVHRDAVNQLKKKLEDHLDSHGQITPAEWKSITGTSRKYSIPLAEHFDQERLTLRVGDIRKRRG